MRNAYIILIFVYLSCTASAQFMFSPSGEQVDQKREQMSSSLASYDAAIVDDWVTITNTEFSGLANNLQETTMYGIEDPAAVTVFDVTGGDFTLTHNVDIYPVDDYVIAFAVHSQSAGTITLKRQAATDQLSDMGTVNVVAGLNYFVRKQSTLQTTHQRLGFYSNSTGYRTQIDPTITDAQYAHQGNSNALTNLESFRVSYSYITTTQKQW